MNVEEYREVLHEDIAIAAHANMTTESDEFLSYVCHFAFPPNKVFVGTWKKL